MNPTNKMIDFDRTRDFDRARRPGGAKPTRLFRLSFSIFSAAFFCTRLHSCEKDGNHKTADTVD